MDLPIPLSVTNMNGCAACMHIMHSLQSELNTYEAKEVLAPASFEGLRRSSSHESFVLQLRQQLVGAAQALGAPELGICVRRGLEPHLILHIPRMDEARMFIHARPGCAGSCTSRARMNIRQGLDIVVRQVGLLVNHEAQQLASV